MTPATKPYKAVAAFLITFLGGIVIAIQDKTEFSDLTTLQWLVVAVISLVNTAAVYGITNPPVGARRGDAGHASLIIVVLVVVVLLMVLTQLI